MVIARKLRQAERKISHTSIQGAKIFTPCETLSWHMSGISHSPNQFSHSANQGAKILHTTIQGAKFFPTCENHSSRCEFSKRQFRTPLFKVRNTSLAHECHHLKYQNGFAPCETRCENFAQYEFECENFAPIGHIFEALPGAQIMHTICRFEAWEVRSPALQTVHDLDLKQRSYGRLKTTMQS